MPDEFNQSNPPVSGRGSSVRGRVIRYALPGVLAASIVAGAGLGIVSSPSSDAAQSAPTTPVGDSVAVARAQDRPSREDRRIEIAPESEAGQVPAVTIVPAVELSKFVADQPAPKAGGERSVTDASDINAADGVAAVTKSGSAAAKRACAPLPGVTANAEKVHQASCARFPAVTTYLGVRPDWDVEHPSGRAVDIMLPNTAYGQQIADYMRANAASLGVTEVIFNQKIWTTRRASEGWRSMSNRGSATANHMDHVHVSVR